MKPKQLYIRKGNLAENRNIIIIGEEAELGSRDSAYSPKGTLHQKVAKDPYTGSLNLTYIHACKNIILVSSKYRTDHDVHAFVKEHCRDLVVWDGESREGVTNSREAFICRGKNVNKTVRTLRKRIQAVVKPESFGQLLQKTFYTLKSKKRLNRKQKLRKLKVALLLAIALALNLHPATKAFVRKTEITAFRKIANWISVRLF